MEKRTIEKQETHVGVSRREIATAAMGALIVPRHVLGGAAFQAPSDTLRIAGIGVGGMGRRYLQGCAGERIDVLCDIDQSFAAPVFRKYPDARVYSDYRKMFDKEEKNIDAVIVATPDHNHAVITMQALKRGKHVYCAKPLTHTVYEARAIADAARSAKVATQMSVQSCASDEALSTAEILLSGVIGPVREVHVWTPHPIYPAGQVRPADTPRCRTRSTGTCGSVRLLSALIIRPTIPGSGAAGGISGRAPSAIWGATRCTCSTKRLSWGNLALFKLHARRCMAGISTWGRMATKLFRQKSKRPKQRVIRTSSHGIFRSAADIPPSR